MIRFKQISRKSKMINFSHEQWIIGCFEFQNPKLFSLNNPNFLLFLHNFTKLKKQYHE